MKILQISPYFIPYLGGQEKYVYNLSKELVNNGHEVHVLTSNFPKSKKYEVMDGINVHRKSVNARILRNPISIGFFEFPKIVGNFDIVHMHNEYGFSSMIPALYKNKKKFPLILTNHIGTLKFENYFKDLFSHFYLNTIGKRILKRSDIITVLSESHKNHLSSINPEFSKKILISKNAIDINLFKKMKNVKKSNDGFTHLLYVGQLIKRKGLKWLIEAIGIISTERDDFKLSIVGDGEDKVYFQNIVKKLNLNNYIEFKGRIDSIHEIVNLYENADIFILPSLAEGLPTVIIEAMYFDIPVIATDIPGIKDNFEGYIHLVPVKDSKAISKMIIKLDNIIKSESSNLPLTHDFIINNYSWTSVAKEYEKMYLEILENF